MSQKAEVPSGVIETKATMGAVVTRADGSTEVVAGETKVTLIDFPTAVSMWGEDRALELFAKRDKIRGGSDGHGDS